MARPGDRNARGNVKGVSTGLEAASKVIPHLLGSRQIIETQPHHALLEVKSHYAHDRPPFRRSIRLRASGTVPLIPLAPRALDPRTISAFPLPVAVQPPKR